MTPEGKVKKKVKEILDAEAPYCYYDMPVPAGYGRSSLDFVGCYFGRYFSIETKRAGKTLNPRQEGTRDAMRAAGGKVFEIIGDQGLSDLVEWMRSVREEEDY